VGLTRSASVHAGRAGRATGDVGSGAAGGCPRRRGGEHHIDDDRGERQRDESADEGRPVASVAQPQHSGDDVRQHEERHVDAADDHFPPRWQWQLDALLQPHRRNGAEEQPAVGVGLKAPERRRAEQRRRAPAEVVQRQHQREGQPITHYDEHLAAPADARGDQPGGDVEQQQFAVERQSVRHAAVNHHQCPGRDRRPAPDREPTLATTRVDLVDGCRLMQRYPRRPTHASTR
jgi:hypothetical protein